MAHFFNSPIYWNQITEFSSGIGQPNVNGTKLKALNIPLAPLAEQKRIVEKLDSLLAQVETIQQRLNNLPNIIKRFRQSVLAAAVSGKLTEQWRGDSDYQATNIGFEIPASWNLFEIQNIGEVKGGKRLPKGEELVPEDTGYRYVRAGQLKNGTIVNGDMARNSQMYLKAHVQEQIKRYIVNEGDAYITIVGASIGDAGVVPANYDGANLTENAAKICEFSRPMNSDFIGFWLRSQLIQQLIRLEIKSGAQGKLALKRIKTLPIPNISIQEQTEIVRLVEQHFALADTLEKNLKNAKQRVDNLTQSILAKAFRGELVPQDPNDEPAEQLLARIKTARAEAELLEKAAKKAAKAKK
jgi:type I restriction enzyme S subunit